MGLFNRTKKVDIFFVGSEGTEIDRGIHQHHEQGFDGRK